MKPVSIKKRNIFTAIYWACTFILLTLSVLFLFLNWNGIVGYIIYIVAMILLVLPLGILFKKIVSEWTKRIKRRK